MRTEVTLDESLCELLTEFVVPLHRLGDRQRLIEELLESPSDISEDPFQGFRGIVGQVRRVKALERRETGEHDGTQQADLVPEVVEDARL